jgi:hypothetical protein
MDTLRLPPVQYYCRQLFSTWTPPAYRRQPKGASVQQHRKRKVFRNKVMNNGRDSSSNNKLWKQLQEVYNEDDESEKTTTTIQKPDREWSLARRQDRLQQVQEELRGTVNRYYNQLFPQDKNRKDHHSKKKSLHALFDRLHERSNSSSSSGTEYAPSAPTWQVILETEAQFRDLGKLVRNMIALVAKLPLAEHSPEQWLRTLLRLRSDRDQLSRMAQQQQQQSHLGPQKEESNTWIGWIKQVFVPLVENEPVKPTHTQESDMLVHQDPSFGPTKRQFLDAIMSIRREAEQFKWEPDHWDETSIHDKLDTIREESKQERQGLLECGNRMSALLDLMTEEGIPPIVSITQPCMEILCQVGSLEGAGLVERIYAHVCFKRVPREMFHLVLGAYRLAALMEEDPTNRAHAATRARMLLQEREQYQLADFYSGTPESDDPRRESYSLVLEAYRNAGWKAIPNMIDEAEKLLKSYVGENMFNAVVEYNEQSVLPKVDMQVFESLLYMLTAKITPKRYTRAKNILKCAEDVRMATGPMIASNKNESVESFPKCSTYNAILVGTRRKINGILRQIERLGEHESEIKRLRQAIKEEASYATSCLDRMALHPSSFPDARTFEYLLDLWIDAALPESGERADEILSRMSLRQACAGPTFSVQGRWIYSKALQCWLKSAEASVPGSLHRALRVLDKMEAATGIRTTPLSAVDSYSATEKNIISLVYEKNDIEEIQSAYKAGIYICSLCTEDPEVALEAAFDLYNRMIAAGILPDEKTFTCLLSCCTNLLPRDRNRREELAKTVIAFAGDFGINLSELNKQLKREMYAKTMKKTR